MLAAVLRSDVEWEPAPCRDARPRAGGSCGAASSGIPAQRLHDIGGRADRDRGGGASSSRPESRGVRRESALGVALRLGDRSARSSWSRRSLARGRPVVRPRVSRLTLALDAPPRRARWHRPLARRDRTRLRLGRADPGPCPRPRGRASAAGCPGEPAFLFPRRGLDRLRGPGRSTEQGPGFRRARGEAHRRLATPRALRLGPGRRPSSARSRGRTAPASCCGSRPAAERRSRCRPPRRPLASASSGRASFPAGARSSSPSPVPRGLRGGRGHRGAEPGHRSAAGAGGRGRPGRPRGHRPPRLRARRLPDGGSPRPRHADPARRSRPGGRARVPGLRGGRSLRPGGRRDPRLLPGGGRTRPLLWVDRRGSATRIPVPDHIFIDPRISPDGSRIAVQATDAESDIWICELARGALTRLTFGPAEDETPVWSPDGAWVAWASQPSHGPRQARRRRADGSGDDQAVWSTSAHVHVHDWSPDGKHLLVTLDSMNTAWDVWLVPVPEARPARSSTGPSRSGIPACRPTGVGSPTPRTSRDGSRSTFAASPSSAARCRCPAGGGDRPAWTARGTRARLPQRGRLRDGRGPVTKARRAHARRSDRGALPRRLRRGHGPHEPSRLRRPPRREALRHGGEPEREATLGMNVVLNWFEELEKLVPRKP